MLIGLLGILTTQSQLINKYSLSGKGTINVDNNSFSEGFDINIYSKSFIYTAGYYFGEEYDHFEVFGDHPKEKYNQINLLIVNILTLE